MQRKLVIRFVLFFWRIERDSNGVEVPGHKPKRADTHKSTSVAKLFLAAGEAARDNGLVVVIVETTLRLGSYRIN